MLFSLGIPAEVTLTVLHHENVSTTRAHYLMLKSKAEGRSAAMKRSARIVKQKLDRQSAEHTNRGKHQLRPRSSDG